MDKNTSRLAVVLMLLSPSLADAQPAPPPPFFHYYYSGCSQTMQTLRTDSELGPLLQLVPSWRACGCLTQRVSKDPRLKALLDLREEAEVKARLEVEPLRTYARARVMALRYECVAETFNEALRAKGLDPDVAVPPESAP